MDNARAWLEMELARQLSPVAAPESLWVGVGKMPSRVRQKPGRPVSAGWVLWPVLALLMLFASGDFVWQVTRPLRDRGHFRSRELRMVANSDPVCDFWSNDPAEIRNWVKSKGNIDVDLPAAPTGQTRLIGAKLVRAHGRPIAAVAYRTNDGEASLVVSRSASTDMAACLMCHVEAHGQM